MDLTRLVESCPLTPWSELPTDPDVITFGYQQAKEAELRSFASWWQEHACQLEWNESRRIFTLRKDAAVR